MQYHEQSITMVAGEALATNRRVRLGATAGEVVYADAGEDWIGITEYAVADGDDVNVRMKIGGSTLMIGVDAVTAIGADLYPADDGQLSPYPKGLDERQGIALSAATAADDIIEVFPTGKAPEGVEHVFIDDFHAADISETADAGRWNATIVDTDTDSGEVLAITDDDSGGTLTSTTNDNAADINNLQANGEAFLLSSTKPGLFLARFKVDDVDKADIVVGMCITDTDLYGGMTDGIYFRMDHDGNLDCVTEKDSTETAQDTGVDLEDDTWVVAGFLWDGTTVTFFVNGAKVKTSITNIPTDEYLTPSIEIGTGEGAAHTISVDYVKAVGTR